MQEDPDFALLTWMLSKENVRLPGFEPGLRAWEAHVITAGPQPRQGLDSWPFLCHFLLPIFKCISFSFSDLIFYIQLSGQG